MSSEIKAITAILPARDEEATIEAAVRSLAAQAEIAEIRVVNDHSTDRTGEILSRLAAELPRLRVLEAPPLPAGWVGKNHAAWFGSQGAATDWLLFTDADVRHLPGSAAHALANGELREGALVSYSPAQHLETWWERAMIPFVFGRLAARYPYEQVNRSDSPLAAANGQYLLIRRETYQAIGGHRAVSDSVLEDVAIARRAKSAGIPLHFLPGPGIAETRMYRNFGAMWEGWTKNLYPLVGATPMAAAGELLSVFPIEEMVLFALGLFYPWIWPFAIVWLAMRIWDYARGLQKQRFPLSCIEYWALGLVLYCAALMVSAWRYSMGTVAWKGRTYPVGS